MPEDLVKAFDAAWERGLEQRIDYSFIKTYKPVMDDSPFSSPWWNPRVAPRAAMRPPDKA